MEDVIIIKLCFNNVGFARELVSRVALLLINVSLATTPTISLVQLVLRNRGAANYAQNLLRELAHE